MIDIIITVFNTPIIDLERCFNSIENQTYNGWKTLIIDDGSKKDISNWLDEWCKKNNIPLIRIPYTHYKDLKLEDLLLGTSVFIEK